MNYRADLRRDFGHATIQEEYNKYMQRYCHEFFFAQLLCQLASTPSLTEEKMFFTTKQPGCEVWFDCCDVI